MLLTAIKRFVFGNVENLSQASATTDASPVSNHPHYDGWVEQISPFHVQGWLRELGRAERHVTYQAMLSDTGEVLAEGCADEFWYGLAGFGDDAHAFWSRFKRPLSVAEQSRVVVRVAEDGHPLSPLPKLTNSYEPFLYDYSGTRTTHFMDNETIEAALRYLPYVQDGQFWFSCLHEPALHPNLIDFVEKVEAEYRRKLFYTTNLSKRMPADYFDWLASNGMHHLNISIESRDPATFEKMRKGARFRIFQANWDLLTEALQKSAKPTPVRYIIMAYKSNLRELPGLASYLLNERRAAQVEIRFTMDAPFIAAEFRDSEFLDAADWQWLAAELATFAPGQICLLTPPDTSTPSPSAAFEPHARRGEVLPGRAMFRLSWDGSLEVRGVLTASRHDTALESVLLSTNIRDLPEPMSFFNETLPCLVDERLGSRGKAMSAEH